MKLNGKVAAPDLDGQAAAEIRTAAVQACPSHRHVAGGGSSILDMGSVHSRLASPLKMPHAAARHGPIGLRNTVGKPGAAHGMHVKVFGPGFVRTPLVDKQIHEQARLLGISQQDVSDGEFTTKQYVADAALTLAAFPNNALTGQSIVVSRGCLME